MEKLAVYVHWPYCARICPYCDFNVYKGAQNQALVDAILEDLSHWRELSGSREIISIHFGGGTPSLMQARDIASIVARVDKLWGLPEGIEIGLEANPQDQDETLWRSYTKAGVNRLSLGVQTFHDPALKVLGRDHSAGAAQAALGLARDIFPNISLDLIFGWTGQTSELLARDLDFALLHNPDHVSAYQLTIEEGTAFERAERRGKSMAVSDDHSAAFYDQIETRLLEAGFDHYEVSNYAKADKASRHNMSYWQGRDYVGVGPGAHGRITQYGRRKATIAHLRPGDYINAVSETRNGIAETEALTAEDWAAEYLLMGLRISEGILLRKFETIFGKPLDKPKLQNLQNADFVQIQNGRLSATPKGRRLLNTVTEILLT